MQGEKKALAYTLDKSVASFEKRKAASNTAKELRVLLTRARQQLPVAPCRVLKKAHTRSMGSLRQAQLSNILSNSCLVPSPNSYKWREAGVAREQKGGWECERRRYNLTRLSQYTPVAETQFNLRAGTILERMARQQRRIKEWQEEQAGIHKYRKICKDLLLEQHKESKQSIERSCEYQRTQLIDRVQQHNQKVRTLLFQRAELGRLRQQVHKAATIQKYQLKVELDKLLSTHKASLTIAMGVDLLG